MSETSSPPREAIAAARRPSVGVQIGNVRVGAGAPIVVQSMTNTDTEDPASTAKQIA
ncbi:MAG: flavodoxin-dependent (E)-4-hydroxy-3-methylbut-2-enyl-diphosphate synthase, partial [Rhodanobacter sp.]|nr:flavodoxin-dependent (E)-4-hydroxy-3-methylbut-2-enyl-diphosphate synthase [Rhodanobacter sp.]